MRNKDLLKKGIYAFTTAAFVAALGFGIKANASSLAGSVDLSSESNMDNQGETYYLNVDPDKNTEIMVGYGTPKNGELVIDNSKMDVYTTTGDSVQVDLSQLNVAKDNYVLLKGNVDSDPIAIKFAKNDAKLKATVTYGNDTANVKFANNGKTSKIDPKDENIHVYGNSLLNYDWDKDAYVYDALLQKGATLYAQTNIVGDAKLVKSDEEYTSVKKGTVKDIKVYTGSVSVKQNDGTFKYEPTDILLPSKAVKVSIAKRGNAPKLKADYVKNTITVPVGQKRELAYNDEEETFVVPDKWDDIAAKETATLGSTAKVIEVRTAQKNNKKPASKTGFIQVPALGATVSGCAVTANITSGGSIDGAKVIAVSGGATVVEIKADDKLVKDGSTKGNLVVDVKDENYGYDVALVNQKAVTDGIDKSIDGKTYKFTAVKAKTTGKKVSVKDLTNNFVFVRRSGDKKTLQFAGKWTFVGTIKGTAVPTGLDPVEPADDGDDNPSTPTYNNLTATPNSVVFSIGENSKSVTIGNTYGELKIVDGENLVTSKTDNSVTISVSENTITFSDSSYGNATPTGSVTIKDTTSNKTIDIAYSKAS